MGLSDIYRLAILNGVRCFWFLSMSFALDRSCTWIRLVPSHHPRFVAQCEIPSAAEINKFGTEMWSSLYPHVLRLEYSFLCLQISLHSAYQLGFKPARVVSWLCVFQMHASCPPLHRIRRRQRTWA